MRREFWGVLEAIDRLVHEGDVDLALRVSEDTLDDAHRRIRHAEWINHEETRSERLHLALEVVQERCHGCIEAPLNDKSVAVARQIRLLGLNKALEVLRPVRLQLNENELHLRRELDSRHVLFEGLQSDYRRAGLAAGVLPGTSEAVDEDDAILGHAEDRKPRIQIVAQHQMLTWRVLAKRPERPGVRQGRTREDWVRRSVATLPP